MELCIVAKVGWRDGDNWRWTLLDLDAARRPGWGSGRGTESVVSGVWVGGDRSYCHGQTGEGRPWF